jgi:hypothetical protein
MVSVPVGQSQLNEGPLINIPLLSLSSTDTDQEGTPSSS